MRRSELVGLTVFEVDFERGTALVHGKGRKDRTVPVGERALAWIERYKDSVRPTLVVPPDEGRLFLTAEGIPLTEGYLTQKVRTYVDAASLGKRGSCHLFRHTCATLMLEGGADVRAIQELVGTPTSTRR
jgi:integrase/recombinase XerD